ncbi:MAG: DUF6113 family protein [Nocardioidaceae bacterium]
MRVVVHVGGVLLGAVVALAALAVHRAVFPLGLTLSAATTLAVPWWLLGTRAPRAAAGFAAGWLLVVWVALPGRPEGDFVVASDPAGVGLVVIGLLLVTIAALSLARGRPPPPRLGP